MSTPPTSATDSPVPLGRSADRPQRVLVVDDDPTSRAWMAECLARRGLEVLLAADGAAALSALREHRPDLLVMDVHMPGLGGVEVCRIVKANPGFGFVPVILVTAGEARGRVEGLELGADDYLLKPFAPDELGARAASMLRLKSLHDALLEKNRELELANRELEAQRRALDALSRTDSLTGAANRRSFDETLRAELQRAERQGLPVALLLLDLDHFKQLNDGYGHPIGDEVLRAVAAAARVSLRQIDLFARYGGEEFAAILPATPLPQARLVAERLRSAIAALRLSCALPDGREESVRCTASIGVAVSEQASPHHAETLIAAADAQLYRAKQAGRNRVFPHLVG